MNWYLLTVKPKTELRLKQDIENMARAEGIQDQIQQVLVPSHHETVIRATGQRTTREAVTFPGYAVIQMDMDELLMRTLQQLPNAGFFVADYDPQHDRHVPTPLTQKEIDQFVNLEVKADHTNINAGDMVRITKGSFLNMECQVETVDHGNSKVIVNVNIFGRNTPVTISMEAIVPV